jgi:hypothetical protein
MKIKTALIVDNSSINEWQQQALDYSLDYLDIRLILNCDNIKKKMKTYFNFFSILDFFLLKNYFTKKINIKFEGVKIINFEPIIYNEKLLNLPPNIVKAIKEHEIKLVINFGISLLCINDELVGYDIISYYHGYSEFFRGKPIGFYELYQNVESITTIVQKLSNLSEKVEILACQHSKIFHYSYKKTIKNLYKNSIYLLRRAIINYININSETVKINKLAYNYRLPSNLTVIKFLFTLLYRKLLRLVYGAFYEKKWNIVKLNGIDDIKNISLEGGLIPKIKKGYIFYADPFFSVDGKKIRVEALNAKSGLGEIVEMDSENLVTNSTILKNLHYSYPYSFCESGKEYIIPEVASHSSPYLLMEPFDSTCKWLLEGLKDKRLVDCSLIKYNDVYYLFCSNDKDSNDCLYLYYSTNILGQYISHPLNPIVVDPKSARMAGRIYNSDGKIYRVGQNNCYGYGAGITINEICELSIDSYYERSIGNIFFREVCGPHTLDIKNDSVVADFYVDKFDILAGYRRIYAKLNRK